MNNFVLFNNKLIVYFCRSKWLFEESTAIFPSLYFKYENMSSEKRSRFMQGRMVEAMRVGKMGNTKKYVYPYTWIKYYDTKQFVEKVIIISGYNIKIFAKIPRKIHFNII